MIDINQINKELKKVQRLFNSMECPDCGGLHQCRLRCIANGSISITFINGLLCEPCWGYKSMVHKRVNELENHHGLQ